MSLIRWWGLLKGDAPGGSARSGTHTGTQRGPHPRSIRMLCMAYRLRCTGFEVQDPRRPPPAETECTLQCKFRAGGVIGGCTRYEGDVRVHWWVWPGVERISNIQLQVSCSIKRTLNRISLSSQACWTSPKMLSFFSFP
jgi:hypothetical protein